MKAQEPESPLSKHELESKLCELELAKFIPGSACHVPKWDSVNLTKCRTGFLPP